jgi:hypothetical protein
MSKPLFSITPALTSAPAPVTLQMPASGYTARAFVTNPCGALIRGATVTVRGLTATPHHLPANVTSYLDWKVSAAHPAAGAGARVSLILASRQNVGRATGCATGPSPYHGAISHHVAAAAAAAPRTNVLAGVIGLLIFAALIAAAVWGIVRLVKRIRRGGPRPPKPQRRHTNPDREAAELGPHGPGAAAGRQNGHQEWPPGGYLPAPPAPLPRRVPGAHYPGPQNADQPIPFALVPEQRQVVSAGRVSREDAILDALTRPRVGRHHGRDEDEAA